MVQELSNIEQFCHWKFNKSKILKLEILHYAFGLLEIVQWVWFYKRQSMVMGEPMFPSI
jgi:hypothetical protein